MAACATRAAAAAGSGASGRPESGSSSATASCHEATSRGIEPEPFELAQRSGGEAVAADLVARERRLVDDDGVESGTAPAVMAAAVPAGPAPTTTTSTVLTRSQATGARAARAQLSGGSTPVRAGRRSACAAGTAISTSMSGHRCGVDVDADVQLVLVAQQGDVHRRAGQRPEREHRLDRDAEQVHRERRAGHVGRLEVEARIIEPNTWVTTDGGQAVQQARTQVRPAGWPARRGRRARVDACSAIGSIGSSSSIGTSKRAGTNVVARRVHLRAVPAMLIGMAIRSDARSASRAPGGSAAGPWRCPPRRCRSACRRCRGPRAWRRSSGMVSVSKWHRERAFRHDRRQRDVLAGRSDAGQRPDQLARGDSPTRPGRRRRSDQAVDARRPVAAWPMPS